DLPELVDDCARVLSAPASALGNGIRPLRHHGRVPALRLDTVALGSLSARFARHRRVTGRPARGSRSQPPESDRRAAHPDAPPEPGVCHEEGADAEYLPWGRIASGALYSQRSAAPDD